MLTRFAVASLTVSAVIAIVLVASLWLTASDVSGTHDEGTLAELDDVDAVSGGYYHTCVLTNAGGVKCWGDNEYGQLGDGTTTHRGTPVDVSGLTSGVVAVAAGWNHTCAIVTGGGVKCWGINENGELGTGTTGPDTCAGDPCSKTPVDVCATGALPPCTAANENILSDVTAITLGNVYLEDPGHTCALINNDTVKCWGWNADGQLGDGTTLNRSTPVDVCNTGATVPCTSDHLTGVSAISTGQGHTCALKGGGVKCWGGNGIGQLGDGTTLDHITPEDVCASGAGSGCIGGAALTGVATVSAGSLHTCALISGGVKCWGSNIVRQLGDGTSGFGATSTPVDVCATGVTVPPACTAANDNILQGVASLSAGVVGYHNCVLTLASGVKCWGMNDVGQVGDGTVGSHRASPVDVVDLTNVAHLSTGGLHTCVLVEPASGTNFGVTCWGQNEFAQLAAATIERCVEVGGETQHCRSTPAAVADPPLGVDSDNDGCTDRHELGLNEVLGGRRDPLNFWDFFDPTRNGSIGFPDVLALLARNHAVGDDTIDPLSSPPPPPDYHTRYDRGAVIGDSLWNLGPPNGSIGFSDFQSLTVQSGHTCLGPSP